MKHYLQFKDLRAEEYAYLFERAASSRRASRPTRSTSPLADRTLAMIFEKASTRTRVSFEAGMYQMGGSVVHLTTGDSQLGRAEPIEDSAKVISRMVDLVMIRTYEQDKIERFAAHSRVPVINGLTNEFHPCQILADIFTYIEHRGSIQGKVVAWVGDGNNMANTWLQAAELLGFTVHVSTPSGYEVDQAVAGIRSADSYKVFKDPMDACRGADLVTTDVWTSMGYEAENEARKKAFADWCVDAEMMAVAKPDALFMHCLPAHRGEEVDGRRDRRPAVGGVGRGREPHARAEGADGVPAAGPRAAGPAGRVPTTTPRTWGPAWGTCARCAPPCPAHCKTPRPWNWRSGTTTPSTGPGAHTTKSAAPTGPCAFCAVSPCPKPWWRKCTSTSWTHATSPAR
jgi:ornithine carbamoyltransferase